MQMPIAGFPPIDAFILVDINGVPIDFSMSASYYNNSSNASTTKIDASISVVTILPSNSFRKGRPSVYYDGAAIMYLLAGNGIPSSTNYTIKLGKDLFNYLEPPVDNYRGQIKAIWSSAVDSVQVTEFV